jgi:hypothetical protein
MRWYRYHWYWKNSKITGRPCTYCRYGTSRAYINEGFGGITREVKYCSRRIKRAGNFLSVTIDTRFRVLHYWFEYERTITGLQRLVISLLIHVSYPIAPRRTTGRLSLGRMVRTPPLVSGALHTAWTLAGFDAWSTTRIWTPNGHRRSIRKLNLEPVTISWGVRGVVCMLGTWVYWCTISCASYSCTTSCRVIWHRSTYWYYWYQLSTY